jgi:tyrosyl-tRNA synthetase
MDLVTTLRARGLVHQVSHEDELKAALGRGVLSGYAGFDPTAASLHVGHLLPVMLLAHLQRAGHRPIALVGGATGLIGDPSGKAAERTMLTRDQVAANVAGVRGQLERFLDFDDGPTGAILVDNQAWLGTVSLLDFLRDIGKHFSVNAMVQRDSVRTRLEQREHGISYTEFSYMLLQAYDYLELHGRYGCALQVGGSDQWGNIVSGADLVRRLRGQEAFALTAPLLTKADGSKFGKSESGNVWLDPALTSPYAFHQFFLNASDDDAPKLLRYLTFLPGEAIDALLAEQAADPSKRPAQRALADAVTRFVHGDDAVLRARRTAEVLFGGADWSAMAPDEVAAVFRNAPSVEVPASHLGTPDAAIIELLSGKDRPFRSKTEARTGLAQGAVSINNVVERDARRFLTAEDVLPGGLVVLRKGKKTYLVAHIVS